MPSVNFLPITFLLIGSACTTIGSDGPPEPVLSRIITDITTGTCQKPDPPKNGIVECDEDLTPGKYCRYKCFEGYQLYGDPVTKCMLNKHMDGHARCDLIRVDIDHYQPCLDHKGKKVAHGDRFFPIGSDPCTQCTCLNGKPQMCIAVFCSPPENCRQYHALSDKCCEFVCLDRDFPSKASGNGTYPGKDDINECRINNFQCSHGCVNLKGRAYCVCPDGFTLDTDKKTCIDTNCRDLRDPAHGKVNCMDRMFGKLCIPKCDDGYMRNPDDPFYYSCADSSGVWEPNEFISECLQFTLATLSGCQDGFELKKVEADIIEHEVCIACPSNAVWSPTTRKCEK